MNFATKLLTSIQFSKGPDIIDGASNITTTGFDTSAQTGDASAWFILLLLLITVIATVIYLKKNSVNPKHAVLKDIISSQKTLTLIIAVTTSCILIFGSLFISKTFAFADQPNNQTQKSLVVDSITQIPVSNNNEFNAAEIKLINNADSDMNVSDFKMLNSGVIQDVKWDIILKKDVYEFNDYEAKGENESISFIIPAKSTYLIYAYPNIEGSIAKEFLNQNIATVDIIARPTTFNATFVDNDAEIRCSHEYSFKYNDLWEADNTKVSREVATFSSLASLRMYDGRNYILDGCTYDIDNKIGLMQGLGFVDNYYCKLYPDKAPTIQTDTAKDVAVPEINQDKDDLTAYNFSHKKINTGNKFVEIINFSISGSGGTHEWRSSFDFGADIPIYYEATGDHPEWLNKSDHKALDVARYRVMTAFNSYYQNYIDHNDEVEKIIIVNSHSRGGGIANLIGKYFEDEWSDKVFTYTFESPNTTVSKNCKDYKTIFNFMNMDDAICQFPAYTSGFDKYGQDIKLSIYNDKAITGQSLKDVFTKVSGRESYDGNSPDDVHRFSNTSAKLIPDRNSSYTVGAKGSETYYYGGPDTEGYKTNEEALQNIKKINEQFNKYGLAHFAKIESSPHLDKSDQRYYIKITYCSAFLIRDICNVIFNNITDYMGPFIPYGPNAQELAVDFASLALGFYHAHEPVSTYVVTKYAQY